MRGQGEGIVMSGGGLSQSDEECGGRGSCIREPRYFCRVAREKAVRVVGVGAGF